MKRYLYLSITIAAFLLNGCAKSPAGKEDTTPATVTPEITIHSLMLPNFSGSIWTPAMVGNVRLELDQVNSKDSVLTVIKDSASFANFSLYQKIVPKGLYNITYSSGTTAAADTFMRFSGELKGLMVDKKQTLNLTASSNDGLITIDKNFIANGTIPSFKPDSGTKTYKLGLSNGFYYLYVKGGVNGNINFVEKATGQIVGKKLGVTALNQLNMAVVNNKGSLQITFVPFTPNTVKVSTNTLAVVKVDPMFLMNNSATWFVATDENGNILSEVKYVPGTTTFKMEASVPFQKDRFNFFQIEIKPNGTVPGITGYLQIKRGTNVKVEFHGMMYHNNTIVNLHLKNVTPFDELRLIADGDGRTLTSLSDTAGLQAAFQDSTRLFVQRLKNNSYTYNVFNIAKGIKDFNVDLNQLIKTPLVKSFSVPGTNLFVNINGKMDPNWGNAYEFPSRRTSTGSLDYYYPAEYFKYYETYVAYDIGGYLYSSYTIKPQIVDQPNKIDASFSISGSTLADFVPNISGTYDYYLASFVYTGTGPYLQVDLYSPAAGNYKNVKMPDFSKYLGLTSLDLRTQKLISFELTKLNVFDENKFNYYLKAGDFSQPVEKLGVSKLY